MVLLNQGRLAGFKESKDRPGLLLPSWQAFPTKLEQLWQPSVCPQSQYKQQRVKREIKRSSLVWFCLFRSNIALFCTRNIKNKWYVKLVREPILLEVLCVYLSVKMDESFLKRIALEEEFMYLSNEGILVLWSHFPWRWWWTSGRGSICKVQLVLAVWQDDSGQPSLDSLASPCIARSSSGWEKQRTYFKKKNREFAFLICH